MMGSSRASFGVDRDLKISQLYHTSWTAKEGVPSEIRSLAQTTDGFLWLGTETGLYRFDGMTFERYKLPGGQSFSNIAVNALLAVPDGGLWIGYSGGGGVSFFKNGKLTSYDQIEGKNIGVAYYFVSDYHGSIWMATGPDGLNRFDGSKWQRFSTSSGLAAGGYSLFADKNGGVWTCSSDGAILYLKRGQTTFQTVEGHALAPVGFAQSNAGDVWLTDMHSAMRATPSTPPQVRTLSQNAASDASLTDAQGNLWFGTITDGLRRLSLSQQSQVNRAGAAPSVDVFNEVNGLSGNYVLSMIEDREGDIWVATNLGLDRFRRSALIQVPLAAGSLGFTLLPGDNGDIWATMSYGRDPFIHLVGDRIETIKGLTEVLSAYRDPEGIMWMGTTNGIHRFRNGKVDSEGPEGVMVGDLSKDRDGRMWAILGGKGITRLDQGDWKTGAFTKLRDLVPAIRGMGFVPVTTDSRGRTWFGGLKDKVLMLDGTESRLFSEKDGVVVGDATTMKADKQEFWIAGERGIAFLNGSRFVSLLPSSATGFTGVTGIIPTPDDGVWFGENRGIIHVSQEEVQKVKQDVTHRVQYQLFDLLDGLPAQLQQSHPHPSMTRGSDGRLWFATAQGLVWMDPKQIPVNKLVPPVAITSLTAGGQHYGSLDPIYLPIRTTSVQVSYTALCLSMPERVRFKYKLEGQDADWQDVGGRREAIYTNLSPGTYHFRVVASNNDGLWNDVGDVLSFNIAPAYYQTVWFRFLYIAAALVTFWLFYRYRLKRATDEVQERLGARMEERERIARELHDTLLQGFQGLILRFQGVQKSLPADQPARKMMGQVLDRADEVLLEGRQRVRDLREKGSSEAELSGALLQCGKELAQGHTSSFGVTVTGHPKPLDPVVFDEVYRVAREALINAFQHAEATTIEADVTYTETQISVKVRDNGIGIDGETLSRGRSGHWGLSGMRERAEKIGGKINLWSRPGAGTEVDLMVPGRLAYAEASSQTFWQRVRRLLGLARKTRS